MEKLALNNTLFSQLNSLSQMHIVRQLGFLVLLAASIALGVAVVLWSTSPDFVPLYMSLTNQDSSEVVATLEQNGTPYKIDSGSGFIMVPADVIQQVRIQLANNGLPRSASRGYDILEDEQSLGTSNFIEHARYNRALEQELVQTIRHIQGVRNARVHLSIPKQTSFIRATGTPTASVMVDLVHAQSLTETQLMGITHLVASSVSGLETEQVSIVDQFGNLISKSSTDGFGNSSDNIRFTREIEQEYSNRIIEILTPIVGAGNVRAKVSADLDFTIIETTEESYDPSTTVVRSEQLQEEFSGNANTAITAEPGALASQAPVDDPEPAPSNNLNQSRTNSTRNYEIDRSVSLIRTVPGSISQLSVAVLVDLDAAATQMQEPPEAGAEAEVVAPVATDPALQEQKIERLTQLVKDAIGFSEVRGDSVSVVNEQFFPLQELEQLEAPPIWEQSWLQSALKLAAAGVTVLLIVLGVLRPAMQSIVAPANRLAGPATGYTSNISTDEISDDQVSLSGNTENPALAAPAPPGKSVYDENLRLAQTLVQNEPARAARMIQNWLANE